MKPKKLTMTAFSSYAEKTEIDFDAIGNRLYLISGETGGGKTTIFDAITFALYGTGSGTYRGKAELFHSDYVGLDTPTEVILEFEHGDVLHKVTRSISFSRKRGQTDAAGNPIYNKDANVKAVFEENGKTPIEGATKVTDRIKEILGMEPDQFRKIVMLAQGEFRKFLDSDDSEREKILGKLFDFTKYEDLQRRIDYAYKKIEKDTSAQHNSIETLMKTFKMPAGLTIEEQALYDAYHPALVENLRALVESDEKVFEDAKGKLTEAERKLQDAIKKADEAILYNEKIEELSTTKEKLSELAAKKDSIESIKKDVSRAEKAVREVQPKEKAYISQTDVLSELCKKIDEANEDLVRKKTVFDAADLEKTKAHQDNDDKIDNLTIESNRINTSLPQYKEQEENQKNLKETEETLETCKNREEGLGSELTALKEKQEKTKSSYDLLESVETDLLGAKTRLEKAQEEYEQLSGKNGIEKAIEEAKKSIDEENKKKNELNAQFEKTAKAKDEYDCLYRSFLSGQVQMLALDLKKEISEKKEAVCPVCGTKHTKDPAFAINCADGEVVLQEQVDKAKETFDKEEAIRKDLGSEVTSLNIRNKTDCKHIAEKAAVLFKEELNWDILVSDGYFTEKKKLFSENVKNAENEKKNLEEKLYKKENLKTELLEIEEKIKDFNEELSKDTENIGKLNSEIAALKAAINEKSKNLQYGSLEEARQQLEKADKELKNLKDIVTKAEESAHNAQSDFEKAKGSKDALLAQKPDAEKRKGEAESEYKAALSGAGFIDENDYKAALPSEGEVWIKRKTDEISKYETDTRDLSNKITSLSEECKDRKPEDLEALTDEKKVCEAEKDNANVVYTDCHSTLDSHKRTYEQIALIRSQIESSEKAQERLQRLNDTVSGNNIEGHKFSFKRYAMGALFREILDMANIRLNTMTGGRYEFVHTTEGTDARRASGLGIEVMDYQTGKTRPTSNVSGGESFQMSMSLALGLSDIVQRHAGGQTIDTMFIDEGFGALDEQSLDAAIASLNELAGDTRQIGIISHVAKLEECISTKIKVQRTDKGSKIHFSC